MSSLFSSQPSKGYEPAMEQALSEARVALKHHDVPVGAVIIGPDGTTLAAAHNQRENLGDPTAHAEILAIQQAATALHHGSDWRLDGCTIVVTLEPCVMCAGAIVAARVQRLVFGAWDDKAGACGSVWDFARDAANLHKVQVIPGVKAAESQALLRSFFEKKRNA